MANTKVTSRVLADDAVLTANITDANVTTAKIANDAITGAKIADDAINSEHYTDGSIDTAHIADDQVTLAKMAGLARGKIIYGDSSGNPAALALGSNGQILKSDGTDISWGAESTFDTDAAQVFNESGAAVDFRIEGDTDANMFFVDGSADKIGIGTNSPLMKAHIKGATGDAPSNDSNAPANGILFLDSGGGYGMSLGTDDSNTGSAWIQSQNTSTSSTEYDFLLNPNGGNVGIGLTNAAETLDVSGNALLSGSDGTIRKLTFGATGGNHGSIGVDASGHTFIDAETAGGAIYFKDAGTTNMTITSAGNVGIGTASPHTGAKLHIVDGAGTAPTMAAGDVLTIQNNDGTDDNAGFTSIAGTAGISYVSFGDSGDKNIGGLNYYHSDNSLRFIANASERMRITSSGNVGVNSTATNAKLEVVATSGEIFRADANNGAYRIVANQDNVMLNGTVLVGTSSAVSNAKLTVDGGDMMVQGANNSAGISDLLPGYTRGDYGVIHSTANHVYFSVGSSYVSYINGGNGTFNVSDQRLKENVATLTGTLDKVKQLRGVSFTWKDTEERGTDTAIGLIAQEVEAVYPQLVDDGGLPKDNDGNDPLKSVNYAHLTSVLIEAIKELSTELDAAKARITTLEG